MAEKIIDQLNLADRQQPGEVGLEIEMEGNRLPGDIRGRWKATIDHSLRGPSREYVLRQPIPLKEVGPALAELWSLFKRNAAKLKPSDRCGVHVHLNCQQDTYRQVITFITLYLAMEDLLVKWCGEDREGNLFCLRGRDAEYIYDRLIEIQKRGSFAGMLGRGDDLRYGALNVSALRKYGSLEFRAMRTPSKPESIHTWVDLLAELKKNARDFSHPMAVVEGASMMGAREFVKMVLPKMHYHVECRDMDELLWMGLRRVQDVAYTEEQEVDEEARRKDLQRRARAMGVPVEVLMAMEADGMVAPNNPFAPPRFDPEPEIEEDEEAEELDDDDWDEPEDEVFLEDDF